MKNPPQELSIKWFKKNIPDGKETKKLKELVASADKSLLAMSMPGDIDMKEYDAFGDTLKKIATEVKALQKNTKDDKLSAKLLGYENAIKITQHYMQTVAKERDDSAALKGVAEGALNGLTGSLNRAEKAVPPLANKLTMLLEAYNKPDADDAEKKKLRTEAKKLVDASKNVVFAPRQGTWESAWQSARTEAKADKLPPADRKEIESRMKAISERVAKAAKLRDLLAQKFSVFMT
jgi:hypothetical protein